MSNDDDDYDVGYKKPPKHTQFKKGKSGNPRGRPKGKVTIADAADVFHEVMEKQITGNDNGKAKKISILHAFMISEAKKALKGNAQSAKLLAAMMFKWPSRPKRPQTEEQFSIENAIREFDSFLDEMASREPDNDDNGGSGDREAS